MDIKILALVVNFILMFWPKTNLISKHDDLWGTYMPYPLVIHYQPSIPRCVFPVFNKLSEHCITSKINVLVQLDKVLGIVVIVLWNVMHGSHIPLILHSNCIVTLTFDLKGHSHTLFQIICLFGCTYKINSLQ